MQFGDYLKEKRDAQGWTQPEAARRIGIEQSYLSKLETGKSYPSEEVFQQLVLAYAIDVPRMLEILPTPELKRLRELRDVRSALLQAQDRTRRSARGWLIASLALVLLGAANTGLYLLAEETRLDTATYVSHGVLEPGEPVDAYDIVWRRPSGTGNAITEAEDRRALMTDRLEQDFITETGSDERSSFIRETPEGRRHYELIGRDRIIQPSPLRWFLVPALISLFGAFACFAISFRWP